MNDYQHSYSRSHLQHLAPISKVYALLSITLVRGLGVCFKGWMHVLMVCRGWSNIRCKTDIALVKKHCNAPNLLGNPENYSQVKEGLPVVFRMLLQSLHITNKELSLQHASEQRFDE